MSEDREDLFVDLVEKFETVKSSEMSESSIVKDFFDECKSNDELLQEYFKDAVELNQKSESIFGAFNNWSTLLGSPSDVEPSTSLIGERYYKSLDFHNRTVLVFLYFYKRCLEVYSIKYPNNYEPIYDFQKIRRRFYSQDTTGTWSDMYFYNCLIDCASTWTGWVSDPNDEVDLNGPNGLNALIEEKNPFIKFIWKFFFDKDMNRAVGELTYDEMGKVMPVLFGRFSQSVGKGIDITSRHPELLDPAFWEKPRRSPDMFVREIEGIFAL